jgi:hypothetical protein
MRKIITVDYSMTVAGSRKDISKLIKDIDKLLFYYVENTTIDTSVWVEEKLEFPYGN